MEPFDTEVGDIAEICFGFLDRLELPLAASMVPSEPRLCLAVDSIGFGCLLAGMGLGVLLLDVEDDSSSLR